MNASVQIWKSFGGLSAEVFLAAAAVTLLLLGGDFESKSCSPKKISLFFKFVKKKLLLSCRKADNFHENLDRRKKKIVFCVSEKKFEIYLINKFKKKKNTPNL